MKLTDRIGPLAHAQHELKLLWGTGQGLPAPAGGCVAVAKQGERSGAIVLGEQVLPQRN